jgi:hypothetical protein
VDLVGIEPTTSSMPWKRAPSCATGPHRRGILIVVDTMQFVKRTRYYPSAWQLLVALWHRPPDMSVKLRTLFFPRSFPALLFILFLATGFSAVAQPGVPAPAADNSAPPAAGLTPSAIVQPVIANVQRTIGDLNIARWKAPNEVRGATQQNASSVQRDVVETLPGLLTQADATLDSVPPSFAVYRNLDALYDVLLRIYETAMLAAPQSEVDELSATLQRVEAARSQLGNAILETSKQHEADIVKLQAAVKAATATAQAAPPAKSNVVDDGPAAAPAVTHKKKKPKPAAPPTPPAQPSTAQPPSN